MKKVRVESVFFPIAYFFFWKNQTNSNFNHFYDVTFLFSSKINQKYRKDLFKAINSVKKKVEIEDKKQTKSYHSVSYKLFSNNKLSFEFQFLCVNKHCLESFCPFINLIFRKPFTDIVPNIILVAADSWIYCVVWKSILCC